MLGKRKYAPKKAKTTRVFSPQEIKVIKAISLKTQETKRFPQYDGAQTVAQNSQGTVYSDLCQIPQGDGSAQRIGEIVRTTKVDLMYNLYSTSSSTDFLVRVLLVSADFNRFTAGSDNWFEGVDGDDQAPTANRLQDIFYKPNSNKFTVVYDKVHKLSDISDGSGRGCVTVKKTIPWERVLDYGSNDTQDAKSNNLRLFFCVRDPASANAAGTDSVTQTSYVVIHYKDG